MTTQTKTRREVYEEARAAWKPDPDDNPDCHWFYSGWAGVKAVCESLGLNWTEVDKVLNYPIHQALCWSHGDWKAFVVTLACELPANDPKAPEKPISWNHEPVADPERAYAIFKDHFRRAYPGRKVTSKFAQGEWARVKDRAERMASEEHGCAHAEWAKRESGRQAEHEKKMESWRAQCAALALRRQFTKAICGED